MYISEKAEKTQTQTHATCHTMEIACKLWNKLRDQVTPSHGYRNQGFSKANVVESTLFWKHVFWRVRDNVQKDKGQDLSIFMKPLSDCPLEISILFY